MLGNKRKCLEFLFLSIPPKIAQGYLASAKQFRKHPLPVIDFADDAFVFLDQRFDGFQFLLRCNRLRFHFLVFIQASSRNLLKASVAELCLGTDVQQRIIAIARTIANLDRSERIKASHLCEAINYRALVR